MPYVITRPSEYIEVNAVPFATPAWEAMDLSAFYDMAALRGEDRVISMAPGRAPVRQLLDEFTAVIPLSVSGFRDWDDNEYADPMLGLLLNIEHLKANVFAPNPSPPYTWLVRHHRRDGSIYDAQGKAVPPFLPQDDGYASSIIAVEIVIPSGELLEGS